MSVSRPIITAALCFLLLWAVPGCIETADDLTDTDPAPLADDLAPTKAVPPDQPDRPQPVALTDEAAPPQKHKEPAYTPAIGDWLISSFGAEMAHLNPYTSSDAYASSIFGLVFNSLLDRDNETMEPVPELAQRWEISEDHLTYTFYLREDVTFSDGEPLTAQDVTFSFAKMTDPATDAPHLRNYYRDVTECVALDDYTVRFTCSKPYYRHITMLGGFDIIPEHIYSEGDFNKHPNNRNPIGSGPYVLEQWNTGQQLSLRLRDDYWDSENGPYIARRVYKFITDDNVRFQALSRGDLDTDSVRPEDWVSRANTERFQNNFDQYTYYRAQYSYIGYNARRNLFRDKRVRRALTMLLDRESIKDNIYQGLARRITGNFMPGMPEHNDAIQPWPFDPEAASALLDEAGWTDSDQDGLRDRDGTPFRFEMLLVSGSTNAELIATTFQQELRRNGIELTIRALEWATMTQSVDERNFDAVMMGWSMPPDPDPYQVWHSSQAENGSNYVGFINEQADQLIEDARVSFDRDVRIKLYRRFQEIIHDEQPYTFLLQPESLLAVSKRFKGITMYPYGPDSTEWFVPTALQKYTD